MFTLTIADGNGQTINRMSFDQGNYMVGRHEDCDIVLNSNSVSRQHARIYIENGRCYVEDLGSSNGVIVDGQRVLKQRDLGTISQIKVGDFYLYLEYKRSERGAQANVLQTLFISDDGNHCKLVRINDSFAGEEFSLSEVENTIGRTDENFILLSDVSISRQHARVDRDGERYTVMDLGSSNGTRVNGKPISGPTTLASGDRVHFGNVEFVFARGQEQINPGDYSRRASGNVLVGVVGLVILLAICAVIGAVVVYGGSVQPDVPLAPPPSIDDKIAALIEDGHARRRLRDWDGAIAAFAEVVELSPSNAKARELLEEVVAEQAAHKILAEGEELIGSRKHREALQVLATVPEDTIAHDRAAKQIEHARKALAHELRGEAARTMAGAKTGGKTNRADIRDAHALIQQSLSYDPDDSESKALLENILAQAKERRVKFD